MFTSNESRRATTRLLLCLAALSLIVAACIPASTATQPPTSAPTGEPAGEPTPVVSHPNASGGFVDLVDALGQRDATVEPGESVHQPFFSVPGRSIKVNGADVQVFEYDDAAARESESATISVDGATIGTTMVTWIDRPNFWARDRVIVLYVGDDADVIARLTEVLGEPITRPAESPVPQALTVHTRDTRLGIPVVDAVIEAVVANDPYPFVVTLLVDERGIVRIVYSEWSTDLLARQDVGELILPPAGETK